MSPNGILKDSSFIVQLLFFVFVVIIGSILSSLFCLLFIFLSNGFSMVNALDMMNHMGTNAAVMRQCQFFQTLGTFFFPALFLAGFYSDDRKEYLQTETSFSFSVVLLTIISMIVVLPFLNMTVYLNGQLQLPESMKELETIIRNFENTANEMFELMLRTDDTLTFLLNFLIVAVIAAVGEEFLFRGVLQQVFHKAIKNHHLVIWIVAIIFSAVHFQFYGFVPRMLLGAYFGYLLYFTKSIWIPVLAHFVNNGVSVVLYDKLDASQMKELDKIGTNETYWVAALSFVLWLGIFFLIRRLSKKSLQDFSS